MTTKNVSVSQREPRESSSFQEFLWWLSTAEKEIVSDCVIDRNRYAIVGMIVMTTWLFATLSWTYFFSTAIGNPWIYIPLGIFMGFIILCIDRALIKGIHAGNRRKFRPFLFRGILALTIGVFMAQPAILYLFDREIKMQISLDNESKKLKKSNELDSLYQSRKNELITGRNQILLREKNQLDLVNTARDSYLREADGTGGTGKVGIERIARAKKEEYEKLDQDYRNLLRQNKPETDRIDKEMAEIDVAIKKEELLFTTYLNDGFLTRVEALENLLNNNRALQFRYYLIVAILMLIELMPVIAKSLLPSGSYDEKVALREEMEKEMAFDNAKKEKELKQLYNALAHEKDGELIRELFTMSREDRQEKIRALSARFREDPNESFDDMWEKIKNDVLSKQEN